MGYIKHHAIIVTAWNQSDAEQARQKAIEIGCAVSEIVGPVINGYLSFMIAPDGSKEGRDESNNGDARRDAFVDWLRGIGKESRPYLKWAEVMYGDDNGAAGVIRHCSDDCLDSPTMRRP